MTYDEWMEAVDLCVRKWADLSVHDLPDFLSRDSFDRGDSPEEGAMIAIEGDDRATSRLEQDGPEWEWNGK